MPVNTVSKWQVKVRQVQDSRLAVYEPILGRWAGRLGDQAGAVQNPAYPAGYVFVRDLKGNVMTMWNEHAPNTWDLPVVYGYESTEPKLLQVLYQWTTYDQQPFLTLPPHGPTHVFGSLDWFPIKSEAFMPGNLLVKSGFTATLYDINYPNGSGGYVTCPQQDIDFTSKVPGSVGALIVLVSLHNDGTVVLVTGTLNTDGPEALTMADIPSPAAGDIGIWAVRLYFEQPALAQTATYTDLFDLRWLNGLGGGGGSSPVAGDGIAVSGSTISQDDSNGTAVTVMADGDYLGTWNAIATAFRKITWANFKLSIKTYTDTLYAALTHASRHQNGGADEVATATPGANAIPKAGSGGKLDKGWIPDFVGSGASHANGGVPDPGASAGTAKFLREDANWATPAGGGDVTGPGSSTAGHLAKFADGTGTLLQDGGAPSSGVTVTEYPASGDTTLTPSNTLVDVAGLSASLAAGTYLITAQLQFSQSGSGGSGQNFAALIDSGGTHVREGSSVYGASWVGQIQLSVLLVLSTTTTVKVRARAQTNNDKVVRYDPVIIDSVVATLMTVTKIA